MNGININNLFPTANSSSSTNRPIDVSSLYSSDKSVPEITHSSYKTVNCFDLNKMLEANQIKKDNAVAYYKKRFNMILNKIGNAHSFHKHSIICEVPNTVFRCPGYDPAECIEYVEDRLRRMYMDTLKMGSRSVFISWMNIEENKRLKEEEDINPT